MRFGVSEGMLLAAGDDDEGVFLISPDEGSSAGQKVR
jgi:methionyl-tRNA synthetase